MNDGESFLCALLRVLGLFCCFLFRSIFSRYIKMKAMVMMTMGVFWCALCVVCESDEEMGGGDKLVSVVFLP